MPSSRSIRRIGRSRLRELPVAFAHMADQHGVELPVHRVHLAEVSVADHRLGGAHQRGRVRVAFGGVPVAVGHQVGSRQQRQLFEAPVASDRVEVEREPGVVAVTQHLADRHLQACRIRMLLAREPGIELEDVRVTRQHRVDVGVGDGGQARHQTAEILADDRRSDLAQQRRRVIQDVAHPVHRVAEQRDPGAPQPGHRLRCPRPVGERARECLRPPVAGDHRERLTGAHERVGLVLGAVDPLVIGQIRHVPGGGDRTLGLDVGQQHRHGCAHQRAHGAHRRAVGQHHDRDPVHALGGELADDRLDVAAVARRAREAHLRHVGQLPRDGGRELPLALGDPGQHVVVELLHDSQQADPGQRAQEWLLSVVRMRLSPWSSSTCDRPSSPYRLR